MKNHRFAVFVLLAFCSVQLLAQVGFKLIEPRSVAMGGTAVAISLLHNPALSAHSYALLSYENRYGVKEFSTFCGAFQYNQLPFSFGATFSRFGYSRYNETMLGVDISKKLFRFLSLGVRIHYANMVGAVDEGISNHALTADLAATLRLSPVWTVGIVANNVFKTDIGSAHYPLPLPFRLRVGCAVAPSESVLFAADVDYFDSLYWLFRVGMEYFLLKEMPLRLGLTTAPFQPTFGLGYHPSFNWRFDLASSYHTVLGFTPSISLQYCF